MSATQRAREPLAIRPAQTWLRRAGDDVAHGVAEAVDKAFVRMAFHGRALSHRATRASVISRVESAGQFYVRMDEAGALFAPPPAATLSLSRVRPLVGGYVLDASWASGYRALDVSHARTLRRCGENATAHARWLRHDTPAPALICVHGWGVGYMPIEERNFSAQWLYEQGLDVLLFVLPFHGRRAPDGRLRPMFPTVDPVRTNEGFAQAVWDLRTLIDHLRAEGAPSVGLTGMSLGGVTTALMATVDAGLDYAVPQIPFPSVADLLKDHVGGSPTEAYAQRRGLREQILAEALAPTTPLRRPPALPGEAMLILAGDRDRVTPMAHAERLQAHFPGAQLLTFPGAHILQIGRRALLAEVLEFIDARTGGIRRPA